MCSRVTLEIFLWSLFQMFTCFGLNLTSPELDREYLKTHLCDQINILISPQLHDTIDNRATMSCDNSGCRLTKMTLIMDWPHIQINYMYLHFHLFSMFIISVVLLWTEKEVDMYRYNTQQWCFQCSYFSRSTVNRERGWFV